MKKLLIVLVLGLFIISCNTNQQQMQTDTNPFFAEYGTPFEVPVFDQINPEHTCLLLKKG